MSKKIDKDEKEVEIKKIEKETTNDDYEEVSLEERIVNIEKKATASFWMNIVIIILVIFNVIFTAGGGATTTGGSTNGGSSESTGYDTSAFNAITPDKIASLSKDEIIVVWIGYQGCGYCQAYAPILADVTEEYGITANYIDLSTITEDALKNQVMTLTGKGDWAEFAASFRGTPFTLIIKNNQVVGGIDGYTDAENIAAAFDKAGIKKR